MTLDEITKTGIDPALKLLPGKDSPEARVMLLAIGLQESEFTYRQQLVGKPPTQTGPAKSFWQGEKGGGMVAGVRTHVNTRVAAANLYKIRNVAPTNQAIWDAIKFDDVLAAGLARLLLWSDPKPLPRLGDVDGAFQLYLRTWRPGAWTRGNPRQKANIEATWRRNYSKALSYVTQS